MKNIQMDFLNFSIFAGGCPLNRSMRFYWFVLAGSHPLVLATAHGSPHPIPCVWCPRGPPRQGDCFSAPEPQLRLSVRHRCPTGSYIKDWCFLRVQGIPHAAHRTHTHTHMHMHTHMHACMHAPHKGTNRDVCFLFVGFS